MVFSGVLNGCSLHIQIGRVALAISDFSSCHQTDEA
jgi:hypothetical protein